MHLNKDVESWAKVVPKAVAGGSAVQAANVLEMALFDIQKLAAEIERLREALGDVSNDLKDRRDQEKGKNGMTLLMIKNIDDALSGK